MAYYVFLDTNIFEESNYSFGNGKFKKLKELAESKDIVLLYNEVIYKEVQQHIVDFVKEAVGEYNSAINNSGFAPFRNATRWSDQLLLLNEQELIRHQWQTWDDYLKDSGAIKIPTKNVDVDAILDCYFKRILPFENKKQNEFKDAIAIESVREYFEVVKENEFAENLFVVSADKGVRKSFRNDTGIIAFDSLNKFINYVILHTEHLAVAVSKELENGAFDKYIEDDIVDEIYMANCEIDDYYDDFDIVNAECLKYEIGYINIVENSFAEVMLEVSAQVCVDYWKRDEDNSYYDREEGRYLFEEFDEYQETHNVSFEAVLTLSIDNLDEKAIKEKVNAYNGLLEKYDESMLHITIDPEVVFIPKETVISMNGFTLVESEIVKSTADDWDEMEEYIGDKPYTTCPDCGKPISFKNDGGNGFCAECAPEH